MSARARIHAMFPILVDDSDTEAEARAAELDARINALVAETRAEDIALLHAAADRKHAAGHWSAAGIRQAVIHLEKATVTAAPATSATDLHTVLLDAVQSFRSSLQAESSWSQQFAAHLVAAVAPLVPYREVWDASLPPGGRVCSLCGQPVESEPCLDHAPEGVPDTNRRARLLHEMDLGGRWKSGDVVRWYATQDLTGLGVHAARHDLAVLRDSGAITQHDEKGVRFYTRQGGRS